MRNIKKEFRHCNYSSCANKVAHAEHWGDRIRYFCEEHFSGGHLERCGEQCKLLMSGA
jgi:hypothetical protein